MNLHGLACAAVGLSVLACGLARAEPPAEDLARLEPQWQEGPRGPAAVLTIQVLDGWKWNREFPFRLTVTRSEGMDAVRSSFSNADVQVSEDGRTARVEVGPVVDPRQAAQVEALASFSVCTEKVCRVFLKRPVRWERAAEWPVELPRSRTP